MDGLEMKGLRRIKGNGQPPTVPVSSDRSAVFLYARVQHEWLRLTAKVKGLLHLGAPSVPSIALTRLERMTRQRLVASTTN